jgi:phosphoribosyl 1,2-cyclic phosphodiesterase
VQAHLCGVRGSTPAPGHAFARYGGNTSCVALSLGWAQAPTLILDAGTGIRRVTTLLGVRPFIGTILLTHLHWDHVQGLPFFGAGDRDDARVTLLLPEQDHPGTDGDGRAAEAVLAKMMSPPHFPIRPRELRGAWTFSVAPSGPLDPGTLGTCGFTVEAREVPHKGGRTFGYRVTDGRSTLAYVPDHCPTELGPGPGGWGEYHPAALELARGADVLIHDALLLPEELPGEAAFGHAAADYAVALGVRAGAQKVVLFHHRPDRTDAALDDLGRRFTAAPIPVVVGAEESVLDL